MAPNLVPWNRLVRFNDAQGNIRYGEPILETEDADIATLARDGKLKVKVCEGSGPLSCKPTDEEAKVEKLLGPLESKDVPLIYCIGLNYKAHSKSKIISTVLNGHMLIVHSPGRWKSITRLPNCLRERTTLCHRPRLPRADSPNGSRERRLRR
jgi:hypothetical protein